MANYKSNISFGLVNIPVLYNTIIKNNDTSFNQLHKKCLHRINYQKYCPHCKKILKEIDLIKGYEYEPDNYITFTKEELSNLQINSKEEIEIISFVPLNEIEPYYFEKTYALIPPKKSKAYSLFLEVLKKSKLVAIAKTSLSSKFYYCTLRFFEEKILLTTLYFEEEVVLPPKPLESKFTKEELDLATKLVLQLKGHFKPEEYLDDYQNNIKKAINSKINGKPLKKKKKTSKSSVKDLVTALQESLMDNDKF